MPRLPFFPERSLESQCLGGRFACLKHKRKYKEEIIEERERANTTEYKTSHKRWGKEALKIKGLIPPLGHVILGHATYDVCPNSNFPISLSVLRPHRVEQGLS